MKENLLKATQCLKHGGVGVLPTDTIYGLVAPALDKAAVERVYGVKGRAPEKPCIILISEIDEVARFGVSIDSQTTQLVDRLWPGPVSIVLPCDRPEFEYLHRGTNSLAFRLPASIDLLELLAETGPLIAPSANLEGREPAKTVAEAEDYFTGSVDFYADAGQLEGKSSTLIAIEGAKVRILRQGSGSIPSDLL